MKPAVVTAELRKLGVIISDISALDPIHKIDFEPPVILHDLVSIRRYVRRIGSYTFFRGGSLQSLASIGRYCSVAPGIFVGGGNHPTTWLSSHPFQYSTGDFGFWPDSKNCVTDLSIDSKILKSEPVIGNDVWIGANVTLNRGVTIGDGAIIAAGSVVASSIPAYMIAGGCPAKVIKPRFDQGVINELLRLQWWELPHSALSKLPFNNIEKCLTTLSSRFPNPADRPSRESKIITLQNYEIVTR
jgi:virginiamycin A acetyltransferase